MKFLVDMPLSPLLASVLNADGHDAIHAASIGLHKAADNEIMQHAIQTGRVVITADLDYPRLLALAAAVEPSVILFRGGNWRDSEVAERLLHIQSLPVASELERCILTVERDRVRRRQLPL